MTAAVRSIRGARPTRGGAGPRSAARLTVLVPGRNEAGNIEPLLSRLSASPTVPTGPAVVLFVDDSDDDTPQMVRAAQSPGFPQLGVALVHRARSWVI